MRNATYPRPRVFYDALRKLTTGVTETLPGLSSSQLQRLRWLIWERGKETYDDLLVAVDHRIDPNTIQSTACRLPWISWGPLEKNSGGIIGICKKYQAELFNQHLLQSFRYSTVLSFTCVSDASAYIVSTVRNNAIAAGLHKFAPRQWR